MGWSKKTQPHRHHHHHDHRHHHSHDDEEGCILMGSCCKSTQSDPLLPPTSLQTELTTKPYNILQQKTWKVATFSLPLFASRDVVSCDVPVKLLLGDLDGETLVESNERRQSCLTMSPGATNTNEKGIAYITIGWAATA